MGIPENPTVAEIEQFFEDCAAITAYEPDEVAADRIGDGGELTLYCAVDTNVDDFHGYDVFNEDHVTIEKLAPNSLWSDEGGVFVEITVHGVEEDQYDPDEFEQYLRDNVVSTDGNITVRTDGGGYGYITSTYIESEEIEKMASDDRIDLFSSFATTYEGCNAVAFKVKDNRHPDHNP